MKNKNKNKWWIHTVSALFLGACTSFQEPLDDNDWFKPQSDSVGISIESLTECGPAVARNFLHWQTGLNLTREYVRSRYPTPSWWNMRHIQNVVNNHGGRLDLIKFDKYDAPRIPNGSKAIFHVYNTHFVTVAHFTGDNMVVWDTNSGIKRTTRNAFFRQVSYQYYLIGARMPGGVDGG